MTCHIENRYVMGRMWCVAVNDDTGQEVSTLQDCADIQYKIDHGYFACGSVATNAISNLAAVDMGNQTVRITWNQSQAGWIRVLQNGVNIQQGNYPAGANYLETNVPAGTHTFCVEPV